MITIKKPHLPSQLTRVIDVGHREVARKFPRTFLHGFAEQGGDCGVALHQKHALTQNRVKKSGSESDTFVAEAEMKGGHHQKLTRAARNFFGLPESVLEGDVGDLGGGDAGAQSSFRLSTCKGGFGWVG